MVSSIVSIHVTYVLIRFSFFKKNNVFWVTFLKKRIVARAISNYYHNIKHPQY